MGLTTTLTAIGFVHRNPPMCRLLFFKKLDLWGTSSDALPMSGARGRGFVRGQCVRMAKSGPRQVKMSRVDNRREILLLGNLPSVGTWRARVGVSLFVWTLIEFAA